MKEDFLNKISRYINGNHILEKGDSVIAAVSGGADSLCLLTALNEIGIYSLDCVHVHHGIRGKSADADAEYVKKFCEKSGIPCKVKKVFVPEFAKKNHLSLEEGARILRYMALNEEAEAIKKQSTDEKTKKIFIACAHNMDDNAETLLMHLFRGSGAKGLAGMSPVTKMSEILGSYKPAESPGDGDVFLIRPLLGTPRSEIEEFLKERGISWRTDETNADSTYTRNAVRNDLLPYVKEHINARACEHMAKTAEDMRLLNAYLEKETDRVMKKCLNKDGSLDLKALKEEDAFIQSEVIKKTLSSFSGERKHIDEILKLISSHKGSKGVCLPGDTLAERRYDRLYFLSKKKHTDMCVKENPDTNFPADTETFTGMHEAVNEKSNAARSHEYAVSLGDGTSLTVHVAQGAKLEIRVVYKAETAEKPESSGKQTSNSLVSSESMSSGEQSFTPPPETKNPYLSSVVNLIDLDELLSRISDADTQMLAFRKREKNDKILIADGRHKTLKKYMIDDKIPAYVRDGIFVFALGGRVLWIPDFYTEPGLRATKDTHRVLEFKYTAFTGIG